MEQSLICALLVLCLSNSHSHITAVFYHRFPIRLVSFIKNHILEKFELKSCTIHKISYQEYLHYWLRLSRGANNYNSDFKTLWPWGSHNRVKSILLFEITSYLIIRQWHGFQKQFSSVSFGNIREILQHLIQFYIIIYRRQNTNYHLYWITISWPLDQ